MERSFALERRLLSALFQSDEGHRALSSTDTLQTRHTARRRVGFVATAIFYTRHFFTAAILTRLTILLGLFRVKKKVIGGESSRVSVERTQ